MIRKKSIIIIILVILLFTAGGFFAYRKIKSHRVLKSDSQNAATSAETSSAGQSASEQPVDENASSDTTDNSSGSPDNSSDSSTADNPSLDLNKNNTGSGNMLAHITTQHCNDDCKAFANNLSLFEYCQQVCGITPVKKVSSCDGKDGIEKDYCLKDLGITKSDASICNQISDVNVKATCKNRVLQDIIENQHQQQPPG